jgi:hypothetical protein
MKNKHKYILIIILLILIIIFSYFFRNNLRRNGINNNQEEKKEEVISFDFTNDKFEPKKKQVLSIDEKEHTEDEKYVTLIVLDKIYEIEINQGDTLYLSMVNLRKKESNFSFNYIEYPSLGVFINEINGIKAGSGKYWFYAVNGKEASVGVSNYVLKEGDIINWELK